MRVGITVWEGTVATTCDFARELLISDEGKGHHTVAVPRLPDTRSLAAWFVGHGIEHLICGAVSRDLEDALADHGIALTGFVMGDADEVLAACRNGGLDGRFAMPGGCRRRRRRRGRRGRRG